MIVHIRHKRTKHGLFEIISETIEESSITVNHAPLCALIYDQMVKDGVIKKEVIQ